MADDEKTGWLDRIFRRAPKRAPDATIPEAYQLTSAELERVLLDRERATGIVRTTGEGSAYGQRMATLPLRRGRDAGVLDPNRLFDAETLFGSPDAVGLLQQIRDTDDVVSPAADGRREMLQALRYNIVPPPRYETDPDAIACAAMVSALLNNMKSYRLSHWVAEAYDNYSTQGSTLYEIILDEAGIDLVFVRRGLVAEWVPGATGYEWEWARIHTREGVRPLHRSKSAYFARNPLPGQFDGRSAFRCLVGPATTTHELYTQLFGAMAWSRGFLHAHSKVGDGIPPASRDDEDTVEEFLTDLDRGISRDAVMTSGAIEFEIIASQVPALQSFAPLAQHQSEAKNRAALNALANIGVRGVGSRSLGEVVLDDDQARLQQHLNAFLNVLSGDNQPNGTLMATLAQLLGYSPDIAPRIEVDWSETAKRLSLEHIKVIQELISGRSLAQTPELSGYLARQLALPEEVVEEQRTRPDGGQPLRAVAMQEMVNVLKALNPDERGAALSPEAAQEMLVQMGVDREAADRMIHAQQRKALEVHDVTE